MTTATTTTRPRQMTDHVADCERCPAVAEVFWNDDFGGAVCGDCDDRLWSTADY